MDDEKIEMMSVAELRMSVMNGIWEKSAKYCISDMTKECSENWKQK